MSDNQEEVAYYVRFITMFIDLATETVLKVFYYQTPKTEVRSFLSKPYIRKTLKSLNGKNILSKKENKLVTSSSPNPDHFDLSLLITLLTNLYRGKLPKPKKGWGSPPGPGDISISDDIVRLRVIRNTVVAHLQQAKLVRGKFESLWNEVEVILVRLVQKVDSSYENVLKEKIISYKDRPLDPRYEIHMEKLQEWKEDMSKLQEKVEILWRKTQEFAIFFKNIPERYKRYIKLLSDGGRFVLQGVLDDEVSKHNDTLEEILLSNKVLLKEKIANEKMFEQLFPEKDGDTVTNTNADTWDIMVLAVVIINVFSVDDVTAEHVTVIMGARISYADNARVALNSRRFNACCEDLMSSIMLLSSRLGKIRYNKCKEFIAEYKGDSPVDDAERLLDNLRDHGSQIKTITAVYEETVRTLKTSLMKMEEEGIVFKRDHVCDLKMVTLGDNKQKAEVAENILETVWQAALKMSDNPTEYEVVRKVLDRILDDIRKIPDVKVEDIVRRCILLRFRCRSWRGLHLLIGYIESSNFQQHLQDIAEELGFIYGDLIKIVGHLTIDSLLNILNKPDSTLGESGPCLRLPIQCRSAAGMRKVLEVLGNESTISRFNEIADSLSAHVEETVTLSIKTDVKGVTEVFKESANKADSISGKNQVGLPTGLKGTRHGISHKKEASSGKESARYKDSNASSEHMGSEEYFEYSCDPCNTAGYHVKAQGYCLNCKDYLCGMCFKSHARNKASCNHALLDKDNMPKTSKLCDPCKRVDDEEEAAGYCNDCGEYLCSNCFRSHPRNKASKQHVLLDKGNMPGWPDIDLTSSVAKMNISGRDDGSQQYNEEYTYIRDINVKTDKDAEDCYIADITLVTSTELILSDVKNKSLKLVDLENHVIKDSLKLETEPHGLTKISQDQVAVVLENKCKIQIISVSRKLSVVQTLNTEGVCVDIKYFNGKLYIPFCEPVKFQILQLTGAEYEVYKTIKPDSEVLKHCRLPKYITVSPDESMIYISDWETNNVMCMGMDGRMISMCQGELDRPCDISTSPFRSVYLCNRNQHVVYKMTSDLSDATVILRSGDGLRFPIALCFNADKQHLYISSACGVAKYSNFIKVYKWK